MADADRDWRRPRSTGGRGRAPQRRNERRAPSSASSSRSGASSGAPAGSERPLEPENGPIRGKCASFCSAHELRERERTGEISRFERVERGGKTQVVAVKKYRRAAAGTMTKVDARDVRPPSVLLDTLRHLFEGVLPREGGGFDTSEQAKPQEFLSLYEFLSDRVRSVRQDFTVQHIQDESLEAALEQIARFHALAGLRATQLLSRDAGDRLAIQWSDKLNDEQLSSALAQLVELYREKHSDPDATDSDETALDLQAEFVAYHLLLRIDDPRSTSLTLHRLPRRLRGRQRVKRAVQLFVALHLGDFRNFFELFDGLEVLEKAITLRHLPQVWIQAVEMLNKSFGKQERIPIIDIGSWLGLTGNDGNTWAIEQLVQAMNIHVERIEPVKEASKGDSPASSWEHLGDGSALVKKTTPSVFVRFKLQPLSTNVDASCQFNLIRSIATGCVRQQESKESQAAAELVMGK